MSMTDAELEELSDAQETRSDYERTLIRGEIAPITLHTRARIKGLKMMIETLAGVRAAMNIWGANDDAREKIVLK